MGVVKNQYDILAILFIYIQGDWPWILPHKGGLREMLPRTFHGSTAGSHNYFDYYFGVGRGVKGKS